MKIQNCSEYDYISHIFSRTKPILKHEKVPENNNKIQSICVLDGSNVHWHFTAGVVSSSLNGEICSSAESSSDGRFD